MPVGLILGGVGVSLVLILIAFVWIFPDLLLAVLRRTLMGPAGM